MRKGTSAPAGDPRREGPTSKELHPGKLKLQID
jgi:hypothetical protein